LVRRAEITRLGEGLRPGDRLSEAAKERTAEVVARFAGEARANGAGAIVLAATSAARDAADGAEFVSWLGHVNDLAAVVLPGCREAELAYAGASLDVPGDPLVLDIGGGSTEMMCRGDRGTVSSVSLALGASRATERWLKSDPPTADQLAAARQEAAAAFARVRPMFAGATTGESHGGVARSLVGVAGTVTTLACLDAGLQTYDADYLHLRTLTLDCVRDLVRRLSAMTTAQRAALPCVQAGRAAVLLGGAVILRAAMETLGFDELTVSERDLLDGLVMHGL
jgi:exopolyphosphatase/guanosine-5'-triphosphate,3'-diphosphate pyrophosphatase